MEFESSPSTVLPLQMWMPEEEIASAAISSPTVMTAVVNGNSGSTAPKDQDHTLGLVDRVSPPLLLNFQVHMLGIDKKERCDRKRRREMTIAERFMSKETSSPLTLPTGWVIEECVRTRGGSVGRVDKYYVDPETGVKFKSLKAVERYLLELEEETVPLKMLGFRKKDEIPHQRKMSIVEGNSRTRSRTSSYELPDGRIIGKYVCTSGNFAGNVDKVDGHSTRLSISFRDRKFWDVFFLLSILYWSDEMLEFRKKDKTPHQRKLVIVEGNSATRTRTSSFDLPDGWIIEKCVRASGNSAGSVDKYYIEPGTMRRFRSRVAVQRRLAELDNTPPSFKESKSDKLIRMSGVAKKDKLVYERQLAIVTGTSKLPEGWVVEERVRKSGRFAGVVDKTYLEPGTMRKFRSLISVQRHLAELDGSSRTSQQSNHANLIMQSQDLCPLGLKEKTPSLDSATSPIKIKWVFNGPGGDTWNPFVDESMVADSVKQRWNDSFISSFDLI